MGQVKERYPEAFLEVLKQNGNIVFRVSTRTFKFDAANTQEEAWDIAAQSLR